MTAAEQPGNPSSCQDLPRASPEVPGINLPGHLNYHRDAQVRKRDLEATKHELSEEYLTCWEVVQVTEVFRTQCVAQEYRLSLHSCFRIQLSPSCMGAKNERGRDNLGLMAISGAPQCAVAVQTGVPGAPG